MLLDRAEEMDHEVGVAAAELAGSTSARPPLTSCDAGGEEEGQPPELLNKDTCKDMVHSTIAVEKLQVTEELDHAGGNSSCSNSCNYDDSKMSTQDGMVPSKSKSEKPETDADGLSEEKVLKKPDKILPCPRCKSMDTKFCYYNNYNVNQPRHFCKSCQRYWTAGGTMRNIPMGAGRRKSKSSTPNCHNTTVPSNYLPATGGDASVFLPPTKGDETAVKFGPDLPPLCNSMASLLNIGDPKTNANAVLTPCRGNKDEHSSASSGTTSNKMEESSEGMVNGSTNGMQGYCNGVPLPQLPCYPAAPFVYPWGPSWNGVFAIAAPGCPSKPVNSSENVDAAAVSWTTPPVMPVPGFCAPSIPFPFVPAPFWPLMPAWPNGSLPAPWLGPRSAMSPSSCTSNSSCSDNGSLILGKHSRDSNLQGEEKAERSLWIPKTLRIDDPDEAAKSSIWTTLGIEPGERGMFKPFQSKTENRKQVSGAAQVLQSNPAALYRSQSFQESS